MHTSRLRAASRTSRVTAAASRLTGFSTSTCLPARSAASACSTWRRVGESTNTASTSSSASNSSSDPKTRHDHSAARLARRSASISNTPTNRAAPDRPTAAPWSSETMPAPTNAMRTGRSFLLSFTGSLLQGAGQDAADEAALEQDEHEDHRDGDDERARSEPGHVRRSLADEHREREWRRPVRLALDDDQRQQEVV